MEAEYIVWGISPQHGPDENVLHTGAKSYAQAVRIGQLLEAKYGCQNTRVQTITFDECPSNFWKSKKVLAR